MKRTITYVILSILTFSCSLPGAKKNNKRITSADSIPFLNQYVEVSNTILTDTIIDHSWENDTSINGRKLKEVKKILQSKDFIKLQRYKEKGSDVNIRWPTGESLRDLIGSYREGIFYFENSIPDKTNQAICSVYTFRVAFIVMDNTLIYYEIGEKKYTNQTLFHFTLIDKYKNEIEYNNLKNAFRAIYSAELNEKELFIESIIYGEHCGIAGTNPNEKDTIDKFVKNKDRNNLLNWLRSTNTEKQIYAVDGLFQLNKRGVKFTEKEMWMINWVLIKKGTIHSCHGCMYGNDEIASVVKKFKFVTTANP
jgi:hypothetical protein